VTASELRFAVSEQTGEVLDELADSFERWSTPLV
jgi:hypothetical protein